MGKKPDIYIHFMKDDKVIFRASANHVPRVGDEIRLGDGEGIEMFYKVDRIVWIYDEHGCPFDRVNIGVIEED